MRTSSFLFLSQAIASANQAGELGGDATVAAAASGTPQQPVQRASQGVGGRDFAPPLLVATPANQTPSVHPANPAIPVSAGRVESKGGGLREPRDPRVVDVTLKLGLDFAVHCADGQRDAFCYNLCCDLANATGHAHGAFRVVSVAAGSVVVELEIHADPNSNQTPLSVAADLEIQASDASSPLRNGSLTCSLQAVVCVVVFVCVCVLRVPPLAALLCQVGIQLCQLELP